ncbi:EF-hand domain-containing protein [Candidatus Binatia bacterium]|nr:EF-hand domain-containing protein [Candidatus Binatia bacterium]
MSSIGGIGNGYATMMTDPTRLRSMRRPDPEAMAGKAFSQLDGTGRGYLEKSDLQSALGQSEATGDGTTVNVDDLFTKLDGDGDGKVTRDEFTSAATSLADELRQSGRMGMMGPPPGPPPGGSADGAGFTKDELTSQLEEIGSSDDPRKALLSSIVENFDAADSDGDGRVSFSEARALAESRTSTTSTSEASSDASTSTGCSASGRASSSSSGVEATLVQQMMRLLQSYGAAAAESVSASSLSLSA